MVGDPSSEGRYGDQIYSSDCTDCPCNVKCEQSIILVVDDDEMNRGGFEALEIIRETYSAMDLPVIMATPKIENKDIVEALKLGANDYRAPTKAS